MRFVENSSIFFICWLFCRRVPDHFSIGRLAHWMIVSGRCPLRMKMVDNSIFQNSRLTFKFQCFFISVRKWPTLEQKRKTPKIGRYPSDHCRIGPYYPIRSHHGLLESWIIELCRTNKSQKTHFRKTRVVLVFAWA